MTFHSNENEALTFSNRRIMEDESILYLKKIKYDDINHPERRDS